jgi:DNA-binding transcriptional LysR family regulator
MNLESIKLSQLRSLVAVAKHSNFSEAALSLQVSQSAVSHAIASLEEELGVVLLSRGRHGAILTPVGERIVSQAQHILTLIEGIGKEANLAKGLQGGQVRIASFRSAATHVLPGVIAQFRSAFPGISIALSECRGDDGVEQALRDGRVDIGFTCLPPPAEFETWEVLWDEYIVLLPPNAEVPGDRLTWEQLNAYPLITPPSSDYCSILIRQYFAQQKQVLQTAYEIQEDSTIVSMVMKGLGATIIARLAAEPLPPEVKIYELPVPLKRLIRVAILKDALHPPAVYAFLDILKQMGEANQSIALKGAESRKLPAVSPVFSQDQRKTG